MTTDVFYDTEDENENETAIEDHGDSDEWEDSMEGGLYGEEHKAYSSRHHTFV